MNFQPQSHGRSKIWECLNHSNKEVSFTNSVGSEFPLQILHPNDGPSAAQDQVLVSNVQLKPLTNSIPFEHGIKNVESLSTVYNNAISCQRCPSQAYFGQNDFEPFTESTISDFTFVSSTSLRATFDTLSQIQQKIQHLQTLVLSIVCECGHPAMLHGQQNVTVHIASTLSQLIAITAGLLQQLSATRDCQYDGQTNDIEFVLQTLEGKDSTCKGQLPVIDSGENVHRGTTTTSAEFIPSSQNQHMLGRTDCSLLNSPKNMIKQMAVDASTGQASDMAILDIASPISEDQKGSNHKHIAFQKGSSTPSKIVDIGVPVKGSSCTSPGFDESGPPFLRYDDEDDVQNLQLGSYDLIELDAVVILAENTHFCEICGKGFKRDANLRMHMRGHGDEYKTTAALSRPEMQSTSMVLPRRYSCPYLGCKRNKKHNKFLPLKTLLCVKNHYRRSHCAKNYTCSKCKTKKFSVLADLKTHEKHCGCRNWQCSCGTTFSRKDKLYGHVGLFAGHTPALPQIEDEGLSNAVNTEPNSHIFERLQDKESFLHNSGDETD